MVKFKDRKELIVLIFIVLVGIFTRFINIDAHSIYIDETWVVPTTNFHFGEESIYPKMFTYPEYQTLSPKIQKTIKYTYELHPLFQVAAIRAVSDVHPPFFFFLNYYWSEWFGYELDTVRTPAALYFIITLIVLFYFLKDQRYDLTSRAVMSIILIFTPYYLFFSNFARPYTLMLLLCLMSSCGCYYMVKQKYEKHKALYIVLAICCMYTHYFGALVVASQGLYMLMESFIAKTFKKDVIKIIAIELVIGLAFMPWFFVMILQMKTKFPRLEGNEAFVFFDFKALRDLVLFFTPGYSRANVYSNLNWFLGIVQVIMFLLGIKYLLSRRSEAPSRFWLLFFISPFLLIILFNTITPVFTVRNCAIVLIPYIVICGFGIMSLKHYIIRGVVLMLLVVPGIYFTLYGVSVGDAKAGLTIEKWKDAAQYIQTINPCPPVYVFHPSYRDGLYYYIKDLDKIRGFQEDRVNAGPVENEIIFVFVNHKDEVIEEKMAKELPFMMNTSLYQKTLLHKTAQIYIYNVKKVNAFN